MSQYAIDNWTDSDCKIVEQTFSHLENKYTLLLMSVLALEGEKSFGEIKRALGAISSKTLSGRLSYLVKSGLIHNRREAKGKITKSIYSIDNGRQGFLELLVAFRSYANVLENRE